MALFDDIAKQFEKWGKEAEEEKKRKQLEKERKELEQGEKERAEKVEHDKLINKIREEYMSLPPINKSGLIGMRMSRYTQKDNYAYKGELIEFFYLDGTRCFLADRNISNYSYAESYTAPDAISDVIEALKYVIPCFAYGGKMEWAFGSGPLWGTQKDRWKDIEFCNNVDEFVDFGSVYSLSPALRKKLSDVLNSWKDGKVLQIIGREAYEGWIEKIKTCNMVFDEMNRLEKERQRIVAEEKRSKDEEVKLRLEEEQQRQRDEESRIRKEKFFAELEARHAEEERREAEEQASIIEAGKKGEAEVEYALKWLDKKYTVLHREEKIKIQNIKFIDEAQEYDHIVVGPTGVILIETKAYSGEIEIDKAGNWKRNKNGEWIGAVNPVQQIRRHEKLIRSFIPEDIPIKSYICLANSKVVITGTENSIIPIVKSDLLVERIENTKSEKILSEQQIKDCIDLINGHMV